VNKSGSSYEQVAGREDGDEVSSYLKRF